MCIRDRGRGLGQVVEQGAEAVRVLRAGRVWAPVQAPGRKPLNSFRDGRRRLVFEDVIGHAGAQARGYPSSIAVADQHHGYLRLQRRLDAFLQVANPVLDDHTIGRWAEAGQFRGRQSDAQVKAPGQRGGQKIRILRRIPQRYQHDVNGPGLRSAGRCHHVNRCHPRDADSGYSPPVPLVAESGREVSHFMLSTCHAKIRRRVRRPGG